MMRPALSPRDRRALGAGVSVILALVALSRAVPAVRVWRADRLERARLVRDQVARTTTLLARRRAVAESLAARTARLTATAPGLITGDSPAAAAATLAGLVSGAAAVAGVRLTAVQVLADTVGSRELPVVRVRAEAVGDVTGLGKMLAALEGGPTLLRVRALALSQAEPAAPPEQVEALRVRLVVEGLSLISRGGGTR